MKEIDFLPEWYKSGKRRQISYRTQYVVLVGIFVVMVVWSFISADSVSRARAGLAGQQSQRVEAERMSQQYERIKGKVTQLREKANLLEEIDSKIGVGDVLAELSFLIDEKIVLREVEFKAERFAGGRKSGAGGSSVVRVAGGNHRARGTLPLGDVRFKMEIGGVAADGGEVAKLICKLEDSSYFCHVVPSFSRNTKVKAGTGLVGEGLEVSEFEISCYLANYVER